MQSLRSSMLVTKFLARFTAIAPRYTMLTSHLYSQSAMACLLPWRATHISTPWRKLCFQTWNNLWWPTLQLACDDWIFQRIALMISLLSSCVQWLSTLWRWMTSTPNSKWCSKTPCRQDRYLGMYSHSLIRGGLTWCARSHDTQHQQRVQQPSVWAILQSCKTWLQDTLDIAVLCEFAHSKASQPDQLLVDSRCKVKPSHCSGN